MLQCPTCHTTRRVPKHCGQPMSLQTHDGREVLACWMGPECGFQDVPAHCDAPMLVRS